MTPYSIDQRKHYLTFLSVFVLAMFTHAPLLAVLSHYAPAVSNFTSALTLLVLVGAYWFLFDRYVWGWISILFPSFVPIFSGRWIGYITTRYSYHERHATDGTVQKETQAMIPVDVEIEQTFSGLNIFLTDMEQSAGPKVSVCRVAGILDADSAKPVLNYTFGREDLMGECSLVLDRKKGSRRLAGSYVSNFPRKGFIDLQELRSTSNIPACVEVHELESKMGERYIAALVGHESLQRYRKQFKKIVGKSTFEKMVNNKHHRDGAQYHLTLFDPIEYGKALANGILQSDTRFCLGRKIWVEFCVLGRQSLGGDEAYYVICHCDRGQVIRRSLQFEAKDFHVTLGFKDKDVYGVPKGIDTAVQSPARWW